MKNNVHIRVDTLVGGCEPPDAGTSDAVSIGLLWAQPHRRRLFASNHQVDVVLRTQAMRDGAQEAVSVGGKVDASELRLEVKNSADEGGVLVRETIVLLTCPCRCLNVVQGANVLAPCRLMRLASPRHQSHCL